MQRARAKRISAIFIAAIALLLAMGALVGCSGSVSGRSMKDALSESTSSATAGASLTPSSASSGTATPSSSASGSAGSSSARSSANSTSSPDVKLADMPAYDGKPSAEVHGNIPFFNEADATRATFEEYSPLDKLGRCGTAFALVSRDTMPTESRGSIGMIQPSGWQTTRYDWVDGKYLFNRCHLIAYQLTAENDNERNLITGTRSLNTQGMQSYEDRVASYVNRTGNHVLYRVTPLFEGDELVARGVLMEALSVEDGGTGVKFCAWCYNVEPGVEIDYATGENREAANAAEVAAAIAAGGTAAAASAQNGLTAGADPQPEAAAHAEETPEEAPAMQDEPAPEPEPAAADVHTYVLNTNSHKFHYPYCSSVSDMAEHNKQFIDANRDDIIASGYQPCKRCNP